MTMSVDTLVSVDEYLHTCFPDGDRVYVDGRIVERNLGEVDHSDVQSGILHDLRTHYRKRICAGVEVRVQVRKTRFRIPDVTVMAGSKPTEPIIRKPPLVAVEVLVKYVWVANPYTRRAYVHTSTGSREAKDGVLHADRAKIDVPLSEIFS